MRRDRELQKREDDHPRIPQGERVKERVSPGPVGTTECQVFGAGQTSGCVIRFSFYSSPRCWDIANVRDKQKTTVSL